MFLITKKSSFKFISLSKNFFNLFKKMLENQEEIQKLASQIEHMKIVGMLTDNRHIRCQTNQLVYTFKLGHLITKKSNDEI